ncbi:MAG: hypothetical protein NWF06_04660 [Candidatus Bathyarchaeota archaeon]|nr:hypothetical protein [Candidatus Bathyarchaeum sp.]
MQTLKAIRNKVTKLQLEKLELTAELEELKEQAKTKIDSLEKELDQLREKKDSFKKLLDTI